MKPLFSQFIHERLPTPSHRGTFRATAIFVDISGFTPITESLMRHGTEGVEALSEILHEIFEPLVAKIYAYEGMIPHFAGDAFTGIFEGNQSDLVAEIAIYFRDVFDKKSVFVTPFGAFKINIRIGLSYGLVEWGMVGEDRNTPFFRGSAIERATVAQQQAQPQQIVMDEWFKEILNIQNVDFQDINNEFSILENIFLKNKTVSNSEVGFKNATENQNAFEEMRESFASKCNESNESKSEFRDVIAVFIAFSKVKDFGDIEAVSNIILSAFKNFGGYFKEIDFSDKNGVMVGFFGAPVAYENNVQRALDCVLAIRDELSHLQAKFPYRFRFGVTQGVAFTGLIGGQARRQYAVVGDRVNLAARLMQNAAWGEILVNKSILHAKAFEFKDKGSLPYKGVSEDVPTFQLLKKKLEEKPVFTGDMVGREAELQQLVDIAAQILLFGKGCLTTIYGEAGVGKSRLTHEMHQLLERNNKYFWISCPSDQILRKSFNPFVNFLRLFFRQNPERSTAENARSFEHIFENLIRSLPERAYTEGGELIRTQSILSALVGLTMPDSLWERLDAKGRYDNTWAALSNLFLSLTHSRPLVIELEDAHWLDDDSLAFLKNFIKKIKNKNILILATSRYDDNGQKTRIFEADFVEKNRIRSIDVELKTFTQEHLLAFSTNKLKGNLHPDLLKILTRTANGNPFYAEQILDYFQENNTLQFVDNQWNVNDSAIKITDSISAILTARIDRLSNILKETVKAAAVIGREFELPILTEVMLAHEAFIQRNGNGKIILREQVQTAERGQIWQAVNELRYIFRHTLLRDAIYDMQLKTRLRELHLIIAKAIEKIYSESLEERYIDLAFHYEQADDNMNTNIYLKKAGDYAGRNFQNQQALDLYDKLAARTNDAEEKSQLLIRRGEILQLVGRWDDAETCFQQANYEATTTGSLLLKGHSCNAIGTLLMLKGEYLEAKKYLESGASFFEQIVDYQGIMNSYGKLGNLYFRQGEYDNAKDYFVKSIAIGRENNLRSNPQIVSNLGLTYMNKGDYTEGVRCQEEELVICEIEDDTVGMATICVNLGIVYSEKNDDKAALEYLERGCSLAQQLGNKQLTSIAFGCLGNLWLKKGDFETAADYLEKDLKMTEELGDRQGIAIASELIGKLHAAKGDFSVALTFHETSLNICRQINYQKGVAKALQSLGETHNYLTDYLVALRCLDEAIDIAKNINNQLVLGYSLIEKGSVLIKVGDFEGAKTMRMQAENVSAFLRNETLNLHVRAFAKRI